ncbi:hypothetical protein GBA52_025091 [Prunus armeniaca]|nr:hypothetical protein GBA52_025091 [Prunus armeniaca]
MRDGVGVNYGVVAVVNIEFGHETVGMVAAGANNKAMWLQGYGSHRAVCLNCGLGQEALRRRKAHIDNALWWSGACSQGAKRWSDCMGKHSTLAFLVQYGPRCLPDLSLDRIRLKG